MIHEAAVTRAKLDVAMGAFTAASSVLKTGHDLELGGVSCHDRHGEFQRIAVASGLALWEPHEASHGRESARFVRTDLGKEHEKLVEDLRDLSDRLRAFGAKML